MSTNEQLAQALRDLEESYCRAGPYLTLAERNEDRRRLIAARAALAAHEAEKAVPLDEAAIRADERERCAQACEAIADKYQTREVMSWSELMADAQTGANECAGAIRDMGVKLEGGEE